MWCREKVHYQDSEVCWNLDWRFQEEVRPFRAAALRFLEVVRPFLEPDSFCRAYCFGQALRFDRPLQNGPQPIRSLCFEPSAKWL
jgi:hypothetical protein